MNSISRQHITMVLTLELMLFFLQSWAHAESVPFESPRWKLPENASKIEEHLGKKSLYLFGGMAVLRDVDFTDGIIEFDAAFSNKRGFFGAVFRLEDEGNYEEFYMRSHQSGNPDALQYTPVYNHMSGWQLYHGPGLSATTAFSFDQWLHIKLVVSGKQAELFIDNMDQPVLFMNNLRRPVKAGKVGLKVVRFAPGYFANFSVVKMDKPTLLSKSTPAPPTPPGTVKTWEISNSFEESALAHTLSLTEAHTNDLNWQSLTCEASGLANISRLTAYDRKKNTVFARLSIYSAKQQLKMLEFGYSDRIRVYLNGNLLYWGQNNYRSRDYRYLGTIGYFDAVSLPLMKGDNELLLAVSENFGGWGIIGRFGDMNGISLK